MKNQFKYLTISIQWDFFEFSYFKISWMLQTSLLRDSFSVFS